MLVANNKRVMGDRVNGTFANIVGWLATAVMFIAAIAMFITWGN
jgi:Mn2+/Fe2+ NRAMP family transporter